MTEAAIALWGIKNCDTMKKARLWLDENGVAYTFRDYKQEGADPKRLAHWVERLGWEVVLNRAGTTFRALPDDEKQGLDAVKAIKLMLAQPSMIKRPVLERDDGLLLAGFKPETYAKALSGAAD
ncbi:arsenate reductase [Kaistia soli DSM 19436]|uniref:Arsenate reductase n=1 Tax=Kaistia soli DSM 19436 TaxID=1122133 RepID=A0A1M5FGS7_9HYPH|nr:ArsC family reductase [Kaistia soli]SHF90362.1 arsenate reductase [Kaistia soli DSM 19436]